MRSNKQLLLVIFLLLTAVGIFLYWRYVAFVPFYWKTYQGTVGHYTYFFSYPPDWVVSHCGKGEIVVAKEPITHCLMPLEATSEYMTNVYFQLFSPSNHYDTISYQTPSTPPKRIKHWQTIFFDNGKFFSGNAFPAIANSDSLYDAGTNEGKKVLVGYLPNLTFGFYSHPKVAKEIQQVQNSIEIKYR